MSESLCKGSERKSIVDFFSSSLVLICPSLENEPTPLNQLFKTRGRRRQDSCLTFDFTL